MDLFSQELDELLASCPDWGWKATAEEVHLHFAEHILEQEPVGSRVTCNPAPLDTDEDYLYLVKDLSKFCKDAEKQGMLVDGSEVTPMDEEGDSIDFFVSFSTFGRAVNIIVTDSQEFFDRFMVATHVAKKLNLLDKQQRILLFQAILYGNKV